MASRAEIEAQIAAAPDNDDAFLVLADVLQIEGDPRGELIAIDRAAAMAKTGHAEWRKRRAEWIARYPELVPAQNAKVELAWHLGFVRRISVSLSVAVDELFAHPACAFVREIWVPGASPPLMRAGVRVVEESVEELIKKVTAPARSLRRLAVGEPETRYYRFDNEVVDLDVCGARLAQLESLFSIAPLIIREAPRLRELELLGGGHDTFEHLQAARMPALERLAIQLWRPFRVESERLLATLDNVRPLLASPPPKLTTFELGEVGFGDELVRALSTSPLLKQLRVLRLWNAGITIEGARHITPEAFGHLDLLDLSDPALDDATIAMVEGVCREVRTISPRLRALLQRDR